ncbi:MarR family winged helix-turn-helix transcriptional regulator [Sulfoacidibacillus thermotolerans]|uniref:HTH marR-type domain-containing protein n=1 Tax=Sulfoacidibacillus thermotolerans TaxID=1765684 RepID=A0A2U3D946_SULT2|nr:MarR family transcriptional regulator [Sulfoacidibacillus thermotolerans]PWI57796.1 hypothetical protein BM613_06270 [Sulfoacidibacillus thermotolerans]
MDSVHAIARALFIIHHRLAGRYGPLTRPQLRILSLLAQSSKTVSELADQLQISSPGVTQALDKLQLQNYIRREPVLEDQRAVRIFCTPAGAEALHEALRHYEQRVATLLTNLSNTHLETLSGILQLVVSDDNDTLERYETKEREQ